MPADPIELVRKLYPLGSFDVAAPGALAAWTQRLKEAADPDFVGGAPTQQLLPMVSSVEEFAEMWRDWLSAWETWTAEISGYEEAAGGRVLVSMEIKARPKEASGEVPVHGANVVQVEEGRVKRVELYLDRDEARRAIGLAGRD